MIATFKLMLFIWALELIAFAVLYFALLKPYRRQLKISDLAILLLIPVCGLFAGNKYVFYGFVFIIPLFSIGKPVRLAASYLLFLQTFPALGENLVIGSAYFGSFSAVQLFNLGALTALGFSARERTRSILSMNCAVWIIFFVNLVISSRGTEINATLRQIGSTFLLLMPPYFVITRSLRRTEDFDFALSYFIFGALINAVIAIFEMKRHWPLYQAFNDNLHVALNGLSATLSTRAGLLRAQGAVGNPGTLGLLCGMGLVVMLALRDRFSPLWRYIIMVVLTGGLFAGQSRGAWAAAAAALAIYFMYERRSGVLIVVSAGSLGLYSILQFTAPGSRFDEIVGRSGHAQQTAEYRSSLLNRGLEEISRYPLLGQTRPQLEVSLNDLRESDGIIDFVNTHLLVALTGGLVGLLCWFTAWLIPFLLALRARLRRTARTWVGAPIAMVGACFVSLTFTSTVDRMLTLVVISMGLTAASLRLIQPARQQGSSRRLRRPSLIVGLLDVESPALIRYPA